MNDILQPMLASLVDAPLDDSRLVYEPKYDGIRAIAEIAPKGKTVHLWSRLGNEKTRQFPEVAAALGEWARRRTQPLVLDGEIVALDQKGDPTGFQNLQGRIHLGGREYSGMAKDADWFDMPGVESPRYKILIPQELGPEVVLIEFPRGAPVALTSPAYGRYEVVVEGSVALDGRVLTPPGLRYIAPRESAGPLVAGPEGATVVFLSFDADALEGGLTGEGLAVAAAEAMARAI